MIDNIFKWLYELALTLKDTFSGFLSFMMYEVSVFGYTWEVYELLFGGALFTIIIWGIVSFVINILP